MKKIIFYSSVLVFMMSCNSSKDDKNKMETMTTATTQPADLPYKAAFSSNWSDSVSDADLKMVLMTYKNWADGDITALGNSLADSVEIDMSNGDHFKKPKADIIKMWSTYRDSLSNVNIIMEAWNKMYATDKKDGFVVTWYKETDTYKSGKADSAYYHDINQVKDGKLVWYSQYKRPAK